MYYEKNEAGRDLGYGENTHLSEVTRAYLKKKTFIRDLNTNEKMKHTIL